MNPVEAIAPRSSLYDQDSNSSGSQYFDALDTPSPESRAVEQFPELPLTFLEDHNGRANSAYVYGEKPAWGWDYCLCFKIPGILKAAVADSDGKKPSEFKKRRTKKTAAELNVPDSNKPAQENVELENGVAGLNEHAAEKSRDLVWKRVEILARLKSAGFVFSQILIPSEGIILVRLSLPERQMKKKAEKIGMELRLKSQYGGGYLSFRAAREEIFANDDEQRLRRCYFCPADRAIIILKALQSKEDWGCDLNIERLLYKQTVLQAFAIHSELERNRLITNAVWRRIWDPSYVLPFSDLKDYLGEQALELTTAPSRKQFRVVFVVVSCRVARVAFYFVFVNFYARRLLLIALLSIPIYVVYRVLRSVTVIAILRWVFSIGLVLWTTVFLETWKRRNAAVNLEWGLEDYKDDVADETRAQFVGDIRYGFYCEGGFVSLADLVDPDPNVPLEDKVEEGLKPPSIRKVANIPKNPYQDPRLSRNAKLQSFGVTLIFVLLVGSLTFLLLWFRNDIISYFKRRTGNSSFSNAIPGILNGLLITVFDSLWRTVSLVLTRRENHRTNQEFENSLVYKRFSFQFVSNYISLLYIAFVRPYLSNTCRVGYFGNEPDCMVELENQLMSLVITKATIGQVMEIGVPFITSRLKQWRAHSKSQASPSPGTVENGVISKTSSARNRYVSESKLAPYESTIEDYGELVLQFGYVALFGLAFPPAAVVALANNLIEGRTDAYKILVLSQRVSADDAADIGAWYPILECLNVLSVVTNAGLVIFTAKAADSVLQFDEKFGDDVWRKLLYRVVAFFIMEHILLSVKAGAAYLIPDIPSQVNRHGARQQYDVARFFNEGWRDAFRGNSLLEVKEEQTRMCEKYADMFDVASEDEARLRS